MAGFICYFLATWPEQVTSPCWASVSASVKQIILPAQEVGGIQWHDADKIIVGRDCYGDHVSSLLDLFCKILGCHSLRVLFPRRKLGTTPIMGQKVSPGMRWWLWTTWGSPSGTSPKARRKSERTPSNPSNRIYRACRWAVSVSTDGTRVLHSTQVPNEAHSLMLTPVPGGHFSLWLLIRCCCFFPRYLLKCMLPPGLPVNPYLMFLDNVSWFYMALVLTDWRHS